MRAVDIILKKRDGAELDASEIEFLVNGYVTGGIPDYQVSAFLMAVYFRNMTARETAFLTRSMLASGKTIDLSHIPGVKIDKHSTGGVGDKVSLVLAPLAASLGLKVPMMAGRGLGHTGGTLDKIESIPGYTTSLPEKQFLNAIEKNGFAIISQSNEVAPADKMLYALRDVTGTVESIPLITASILSKKCAEGSDSLVFDVKCGTGAFMKTLSDAEALACSLVNIGRELGKAIKVVITEMNQPLGMTVGNFLEIKEVLSCLQGNGPSDIMEITYCLTAWMLILAGMETNMTNAVAKCQKQIANGAALQKFLENVACQGGDTDTLTNPQKAPVALYRKEFYSPAGGFIERIDAFLTGTISMILGAGRAKKDDPVAPGAGILLAKKCGDRIDKGELFCTFYADNNELFDLAGKFMEQGLIISPTPVFPHSLILKEI